MASTQQIRRRIKSVKNTKQITKAMELVAASKMRRAQEATMRSRAYRNVAREILARLRTLTDVSKNELFAKRDVKTRLLIVVTSDRGLAGAYNSNVLRQFNFELAADERAGIKTKVLIIGKKGAQFAGRIKDLATVGVYENLLDNPTDEALLPIVQTVTELFTSKEVDAVDLLFTDFKSTVTQVVTVERVLPAAVEVEISEDDEKSDMVFEPSAEAVLSTITPRLVEVQVFQALLESVASEHSMRMMAMKNASDNAGELIDDLTLEFNSARQAAITQELAEITGGAEAVA